MSGASELPTDGRDLDRRLTAGEGLGLGQRTRAAGPDRPMPGAGEPVWDRDPAERVAGEVPTYYGQPVVKAPPWGAPVAAYLVTGGACGSAAALAAVVDLLGGEAGVPVVRAARALAAVTGAGSAGLLLADLGRPARFLNMYRVARPTSAMSMGSYLLSATTGSAVLAVALGGRPGLLGGVGRAAGLAAGATGIPLSGYTGVLLGATALPGWNVGIRTLPGLFMASGAATSGSLLRVLPLGPPAQRTVSTVTLAAQVAELVTERRHERVVAARPRVQAAYDAQPAWRAGRVLTLASFALGLAAGRHPALRVAAGALGVAGASLTKVAVFRAGIATAADPLTTHEAS
jgi:hypothetical protein